MAKAHKMNKGAKKAPDQLDNKQRYRVVAADDVRRAKYLRGEDGMSAAAAAATALPVDGQPRWAVITVEEDALYRDADEPVPFTRILADRKATTSEADAA